MTILITGAAGFIGSAVTRKLLGEGFDIISIGRTAPFSSKVKHLPVDFSDFQKTAQIIKSQSATTLVHTAWFTKHGEFWNSPLNLQCLSDGMNILQAFADSGGERVIALGSCAELMVGEGSDTVSGPDSVYGKSKLLFKQLAENLCDSKGLDFCWAKGFFLLVMEKLRKSWFQASTKSTS